MSAEGEISVQRLAGELSDGHSEDARFLVSSLCCLIGFGGFWKWATSTLVFCIVSVSDGEEGMATMCLQGTRKQRGMLSLLSSCDPCHLASLLAGCCLLKLGRQCAPGALRADGVLDGKQDLT